MGRFLVVAACGLAFGLTFGFSYGVGNQDTYLLDGLHQRDPHFLEHDWLVTETTHYHRAFSWVIHVLHSFGNAAWNMAMAHVLVIALAVVVLDRILTKLNGKQALLGLLPVLGFQLIDHTSSVANSYLFSHGLQPSTFATLLFLAAVACFLAGRTMGSGLCLAVAGWFHANFLVLGMICFLAARVLVDRGLKPRTLLRQLGPSIPVLVWLTPMLVNMTTDPEAAAGREIFLHIRSPHHYVPMTFLSEFVPLAGWSLVVMAFAPWQSPDPVQRRLTMLWVTLVGLIAGATLLTTVVYVPAVAQLYVWRLAPFCVLLSQVTIVHACLRWCEDEQDLSRSGRWVRRVFVHVGLVILFVCYGMGIRWLLVAVSVVCSVALSRNVESSPQWRARAALLVVVIGFLACAIPAVDRGLESSNLLNPVDPRSEGLFRFAATTDSETRFVVPPALSSFRLQTERAIVVDWKSTPILGGELVEWYRRIVAISGGEEVQGLAEAEDAYARMDEARARSLAVEFDCEYVVVESSVAGLPQPPVFADDHYSVYRLRR